jgi:hypothetical protein
MSESLHCRSKIDAMVVSCCSDNICGAAWAPKLVERFLGIARIAPTQWNDSITSSATRKQSRGKVQGTRCRCQLQAPLLSLSLSCPSDRRLGLTNQWSIVTFFDADSQRIALKKVLVWWWRREEGPHPALQRISSGTVAVADVVWCGHRDLATPNVFACRPASHVSWAWRS